MFPASDSTGGRFKEDKVLPSQAPMPDPIQHRIVPRYHVKHQRYPTSIRSSQHSHPLPRDPVFNLSLPIPSPPVFLRMVSPTTLLSETHPSNFFLLAPQLATSLHHHPALPTHVARCFHPWRKQAPCSIRMGWLAHKLQPSPNLCFPGIRVTHLPLKLLALLHT